MNPIASISEPASAPGSERPRWGEVMAVVVRWLLGALFLYMGLSKASDPVGFLKLVREYEVLKSPYLLNFVAVTVPWLEVLCGLLLILGVAVRGTALLLAGLLISFTALVWWRALGLQEAGQLPFCSVRFDCGCGNGPVLICRKLVENGVLIVLALWLLFPRRHRLSLFSTLSTGLSRVHGQSGQRGA